MSDGNYITNADQLKTLSRQLNLWNDKAGVFDSDAMDDDRDAAEAAADSYVRVRYNTPVTSTEGIAILRAIVIDLLIYKGYGRLGTGEIPEEIETRFNNARIDLEKIANGKTRLPETAEEPDPNGPDNSIFSSSNTPEATKDELAGY